jgi:hypothetical protein
LVSRTDALEVVMPAITPRAFLAIAIVLLVAATEAAILYLRISSIARDILQVIVGVLIAKFGTVYDYYFGSAKPAVVGE